MLTIVVEDGQNMVDIAVQEYGTVEALVELALLNGLEIDADLQAGQTLLIDNTSSKRDAAVVGYFKDKVQLVNSGNIT